MKGMYEANFEDADKTDSWADTAALDVVLDPDA
jgi:hypothetical protein